MTFIDWSDAEGLFGLLLDFVADETARCEDDLERHRFLSGLRRRLRALEARLPELETSAMIDGLRQAHETVDPVFAGDPVVGHVRDCIAELQRIQTEAASSA